MTTVAEVMDDVALECAVAVPASWLAVQSNRTYAELSSILRQTVREMLDRVDWPAPIGLDTTITGTGVEGYDLPGDFRRLTRDELAVYETTMNRACIPVASNGAWTHLKQIGSAGGERFYRTAGDDADGFTIDFYRPLETGSSVTVSYVSKNWLKHSGTAQSAWESVSDTLLLPDTVVQMGCVWRFKKRKGLPYQATLNEYEANLARLANDARGRRKITFAPPYEQPLPMRVPVPDYIPSS